MAKKKKEKSGLTLWEVLNIITKRKKGVIGELDKSVSVWMLNRFLSMSPLYLDFINDIQNLPKVIELSDYINILNKILPKNPSYLSYVKKEKDKIIVRKKEEHVFDDMIAFGYSRARAKEYIAMMRRMSKTK